MEELVRGALQPRHGVLKPGTLEPWGAQTTIRKNSQFFNNLFTWSLNNNKPLTAYTITKNPEVYIVSLKYDK